MKKINRAMSVLLIVAMLLSMFTSFSFAAYENTGTRHVLCTALSSQAETYYAKNGFDYDEVAELEGGNESCLQSVNSKLFKELHDLMDDTMIASITYNELKNYWKNTDREKGTNNATLFYSDVTSGSYNREHVWPKSRASFHQQDGGCDIHHLRPTNSNINSTRSNFTMGNVREVCSSYERATYSNNTVLWYNKTYSGNGSHGLVEINDNIKGDVARIFLYVYVRWEERNLFENDPSPKQANNDSGGNNGWKVIYDLETLLEWCEMDPVDTWEMSRNDKCQDIQGNRNVFIDYPEFAWLIFGQEIPDDMTTPSGKAKDSSKFNITVAANNDAYGTVSISGKTITATPNVGYEVDGYTLTPSNAATVTREGNTFKLSKVTADCTLTVNFKARIPATVTYHVAAGLSANGTTNGYVGDVIKLASVSGTVAGSAQEYSFVGWGANAVQQTTSKPSTRAAGSNYTLSAPETEFYAVLSYVDGGTTYYLTSPCAHENVGENRIEPTCDKAGAEQIVCNDCGYVLETTPIAKLGHDYKTTTIAPTCTDKGYDLYSCTRCDDNYKKNYTAKLGHDYEVTTVEPTHTQQGYDLYTCTRCGDSYMTNFTELTEVSETYTDISENDWYYDAVSFIISAGLMNGVSENQFAPNDSLTRAMLVTILYRAMETPSIDGLVNPFTDVADGQWYTDAIIWAANYGIVNGTTATTFAPNASISREQIATILYRLALKLEYDPSERSDISTYPDANKVSSYALDAISWASGSGLINGIDGKLAPADLATRAQFATLLMRFTDWCSNQAVE